MGSLTGPLKGIKILDLTHVWAGPLAVRFLADLGAEVVKVEAPYGRGPRDFETTPIGGWLGGEPGLEPWNVNAFFSKLHRNRQSLCVDLKNPKGRVLLLALVTVADVIIENFSARAMPAMELGFDVLKRANSKIVYVSMPGFGASGPYRDRVAFGPIVEPMSGLTTMLGYDAQNPRNSAMALMDPIAATHAAGAVLTALRQRDRDGEGQYVELSLHEGGVTYSGPWLLDLQLGQRAECVGNRHPHMAPHGVYACQDVDQWLALACENDSQWQGLCEVIASLDASMNYMQRQKYTEAIDTDISAWTEGQNKQTAVQTLQMSDVPAGEVNAVPDMLEDPQVQEREFFVAYEQFNTPMPGNPIRMPELDSSEWAPCPGLGANNASVLQDWLGMDVEEVLSLKTAGVLADEPPL